MLAGNPWIRVGEPLLSLRAAGRGYGGGLRPCLYVKGVQKFLPVFKASTEVMLGHAVHRGQREPEPVRPEHGALPADARAALPAMDDSY